MAVILIHNVTGQNPVRAAALVHTCIISSSVQLSCSSLQLGQLGCCALSWSFLLAIASSNPLLEDMLCL
jgi:hypothetical protein